MKQKIAAWITKSATYFGALALVLSTGVMFGCKLKWYQPAEPEGLAEFAEMRK